jgi:cysteinyl-tRNA synthetase
VSLRLYDTGTRAVRPFTPRVPGEVGLYVCGPTVQAAPHVGHLRSAVALDVLHRWLQADAVRDRLAAAGVVLEDTSAGVRWRLEGRSAT